MVSMLRKRTCILVSMSIPCHICEGKGVSRARVPVTNWHPPSGEVGRDGTNLEEVFEGDALIHLVWPLCAARENTLRPPCTDGAGTLGQGVTRGWVPWGCVSQSRAVLVPRCAPWPAPNWFPEPSQLQGAAGLQAVKPQALRMVLYGVLLAQVLITEKKNT